MEHKALSVAQFREVALAEAQRVTGHKGQAGSASASGVGQSTSRRLETRKWVRA